MALTSFTSIRRRILARPFRSAIAAAAAVVLVAACSSSDGGGSESAGGGESAGGAGTVEAAGGATGESGGGPEASGGGESADAVHIGVILPLTGSTAQNGNNALKGAELAAELINADGGIKSMGGAKIKLDVADATSDPAQAATVATQFLSTGTPPMAILGAYASGLTLTVAQVTERKKIPLITTSFSDELVSKGYKHLFQIAPKASVIGGAQMLYASQIAEEMGSPIEKAAIVYADNAYGESQNEGLVSQAKELGIEVAVDEGYSPEITDAGPVVQKVLASDPDVIFSIAYVTDGVLLVRALKAQGNTAPIVGGTGGYVTPDFGSAMGKDANGVMTIDTSDPDAYGDFAEEYQSKYGDFPAQEAHDQAAGLYAVAQALEEHPTTDPSALNETLHSGSFDMGTAGTMPGGKIEWDETGANTVIEPLMVQWQDGKLVGVWPSDLTSHKPTWGTD